MRHLSMALTALVLVGFLTGCGSDEDPVATDSSDTLASTGTGSSSDLTDGADGTTAADSTDKSDASDVTTDADSSDATDASNATDASDGASSSDGTTGVNGSDGVASGAITDPFTVVVPSKGAGVEGVGVRVVPNTGAPRYDKGAPIVVLAPGGWAKGTVGNEVKLQAHKHGMIFIEFLLPEGKSVDGLMTGGTYDVRGPNCHQVAADVLMYAMGKKADKEGKLITDMLPHALTAEVGAIGTSNGGNLVLTALGHYPEDLKGVRWFVAWESPVGDQFAAVELNGNSYYTPGTCTATTCPTPKMAENLKWDASLDTTLGNSVSKSFPGRLVLDGADNPTEIFQSHVAGYSKDGEVRAYPSQELAAAISTQADTLWPGGVGLPEWLVFDAAESKEYWQHRDGALHIGAIHEAFPDLLVMHLQASSDHVQSQPDHPHALAHLLGWLDEGHKWVRLNPDKAYMTSLLKNTSNADQLPDNDANVGIKWPGANDQTVPNAMAKDIKLAGILELADRVHMGNTSANLSEVLVSYSAQSTGQQGGGPTPPDTKCKEGQTDKCCGDGKCGGPENQSNCPEDCK